MEGIWKVYENGRAVGSCCVERAGLYWHFRCRCRIESKRITRLSIQIGQFRKNLGVLVPADGSFVLECREPVRAFPEGTPEFSAVGGRPVGKFAPVYPDEPFSYIEQLENAHLERRNGVLGIRVE